MHLSHQLLEYPISLYLQVLTILSQPTLRIALNIIARVCFCSDYKREMRGAGMIQALRKVCEQKRGEEDDCKRIADRLLESLLEIHLAFSMGQNARLGACSPVNLLDDYVAGIIMEYALLGKLCPGEFTTPEEEKQGREARANSVGKDSKEAPKMCRHAPHTLLGGE